MFGGLAAVAVIAAVVIALLFVVREDPGAKSVTQAVEEFRTGEGQSHGGAGPARPAAGVYAAMGDGRAELSFPPLSQRDGPEIPLTVQHDADGCWIVKVDYNEAHWQNWQYCRDESGRMFERGGQTYQRWDLGATKIENTSTFVCDPPSLVIDPAAQPAASWPQSCTGTNTQTQGTTTSAGNSTFIGVEPITIGNGVVSALHYRQQSTISGSQTGEQTVDTWFTADSGLPVRVERTARIDSSSPVGSITYTEDGRWQLQSLDPAV